MLFAPILVVHELVFLPEGAELKHIPLTLSAPLKVPQILASILFT